MEKKDASLEKEPLLSEPGLRSILGQPDAVEFLFRAMKSERLATCLLFEGADGVGKERCARALAQCLLCEQPLANHDACGSCRSCRLVSVGQHPDVIVLAKDVDVLTQKEQSESDAKSEITIDKVRTLQSERLAYFAHTNARIIIVRDAHELNGPSANALLKTLEEPPTNTHFILLTHRPSELLLTVKSRSQRVRFGSLAAEHIESILRSRGADPSRMPELVQWADGSAARGFEAMRGDVLSVRRGWVEQTLSALRAGKPGAVVELSESLSKYCKTLDGELEAILHLLERHFRDEAIEHASDSKRALVCAARSQFVRQTAVTLDRNANAQIAIEAMLVRLREVRA